MQPWHAGAIDRIPPVRVHCAAYLEPGRMLAPSGSTLGSHLGYCSSAHPSVNPSEQRLAPSGPTLGLHLGSWSSVHPSALSG